MTRGRYFNFAIRPGTAGRSSGRGGAGGQGG